MNYQIITSPKGDRLVVIPEREFASLLAAAEDAADRETVRQFRDRLASGEEELLPAAMVKRILDGENAIRVWREHRNLTVRALAEKVGIAQPYLSQVETGKREGTVETLKKIAEALGVSIEELV